MLRKAKYPERIDKVLTRTLKGLKIDRRVKEESAILNWSKVVGDRIASYANPLRVRDSILFVRVENASWRNELVFLKGKIIKELKAILTDKKRIYGIIKEELTKLAEKFGDVRRTEIVPGEEDEFSL